MLLKKPRSRNRKSSAPDERAFAALAGAVKASDRKKVLDVLRAIAGAMKKPMLAIVAFHPAESEVLILAVMLV